MIMTRSSCVVGSMVMVLVCWCKIYRWNAFGEFSRHFRPLMISRSTPLVILLLLRLPSCPTSIDTAMAVLSLLLLLACLLLACHGICAESVGHVEDFNSFTSMSGKFKLFDDSNAKLGKSSRNITIPAKNEADGAALLRCQSALETSMKKMERMVEEFNAELDTLEHNLKKTEKQAKAAEDRAREARRKLAEADSELGYMHTQAVSTYFNSTLVKEDSVKSVQKRISGTMKYVENCYRRRLSHRMRRIKQLYNAELRRQQPNIAALKRKIATLAKKAENRWEQSSVVRPFVQRSFEKIFAHVEPSLKVVQEAVYLSTVSAIEEVSRAGISFLDALAETQKIKASLDQERQLGRRRRATKDRHGKPKKNKIAPKKRDEEDVHFTTSLLHRKVQATLEYGLSNSKRIANRCSQLLPLAVSLFVTGQFLLGSVLLLLGVPASFLWLICLVKLVCNLIKRFFFIASNKNRIMK